MEGSAELLYRAHGETARRRASVGDLGRGGAPLADQQIASRRNKEPVLVWSHTGPGFHNMMEACGPIRSDSPLQGGSSALIHSFVYSFIQLRASQQRDAKPKAVLRTILTCPCGEESGASLDGW